jgi:hypothetical protein
MSSVPSIRDYSKPTRLCDIVMKGGITSGVVYPGAVCELASEYRFKSVGGASAGAIAAAATAAAEYRRERAAGGPDAGTGFKILEDLPNRLGGKPSKLFGLFKPERSTRALYKTLTAGLEGHWPVLRTLIALLWNFLIWTILGALPGLLFGYLATWGKNYDGITAARIACITIALSGAVALPLLAFLVQFMKRVPANGYGLCRGFDGSEGKEAPLTPWLADLLDEIAGKDPAKDGPLTFGDLWGADKREDAIVNLDMMTTNVSYGRPYRLPFFPDEENIFYFKESEFEMLFPKRIVEWLKKKGTVKDAAQGLYHLPPSKDMPVVVATRMSLSFPVLISAVPLYGRIHRPKNDDEGVPQEIGRCWFSDGGIGSNFPIHLFDSPLPRWPTFAIDLRYTEKKVLSDYDRVYMPHRNSGGLSETWNFIDDERGRGNLTGFLWAIVETMHNWGDNTMLRLPGFRDRVAHIYLTEEEGGLNLSMDELKINNLNRFGTMAALILKDRFQLDRPKGKPGGWLSWNNHRWTRYRTTMAQLEDVFLKMEKALDGTLPPGLTPIKGEETYAKFIERLNEELPSYPWSSPDGQKWSVTSIHHLLGLIRAWKASKQSFQDEHAPHPMPIFRPRPRI